MLKDGNIRWFVLTGILTGLANQMGYVFLSIYAKDLGAQNAHLGWLWGLGTVAETLVMPFVGAFMHRIGIKKLILLGILASIIRWAGTAFATSWLTLVPFQLLHGFTFTFIFVGSVTFMDVSSPPIIRSSSQAVFGLMVMNTARIIATPLSGEIAYQFGYQTLYLSAAVMGCLSLILLAVFVNEPRQVEMTLDQESSQRSPA